MSGKIRKKDLQPLGICRSFSNIASACLCPRFAPNFIDFNFELKVKIKYTNVAKFLSFYGEKATKMNSLESYSVEVNTFFFLKTSELLFTSIAEAYIVQIALSAFSHTAKYFLEGLTANAVIPSEPSIPIN